MGFVFLILVTGANALSSVQEQAAMGVGLSLFFIECAFVGLIYKFYAVKGSFWPLVYFITFMQYSMILVSNQLDAGEGLNRVLRPFSMLHGYPYNFIQNGFEELLVGMLLAVAILVKYAKNRESRHIKEIISLMFLLSVQDFLYYDLRCIKGIADSKVTTVESYNLFAALFCAIYFLLFFIYLWFLRQGHKKSTPLATVYNEDFPKCTRYSFSFLLSLIFGAFISALLEQYDVIRLPLLILPELFQSNYHLVTIFFTLKINSLKKWRLGLYYHSLKILECILILLNCTKVLTDSICLYVFFCFLYTGAGLAMSRNFVKETVQKESSYKMDNTLELSMPNESPSKHVSEINGSTTNGPETLSKYECKPQDVTFSFERPARVHSSSVSLASKQSFRDINVFTVRRTHAKITKN